MKQYRYRPLETDRSIRILKLRPSNSGGAEQLESAIEHVILDDKPEFEAASWVWGSPEKTTSIKCQPEETCLQISQNLNLMLSALRLPDSERVLWVDALCINQEDRNEKAKQIPLMRDIYSSAEQVVAWVGEEADAVSTAKGANTLEIRVDSF